jgi:putative RNA 2'-phosphotransferase
MTVRLERLSKLVSHALRHEPKAYDLHLDEEGWTSIAALLNAIRRTGGPWADVTEDDLCEMIATAAKQRHEIDGSRIRALYGHSLPGRIEKKTAEPPEYLFHGTSPRSWDAIRSQGLLPMSRQYVHLARDESTAALVGRRNAADPVILVIRARDAHDAGVRFRLGNDAVWLADAVPAKFIAEFDAAARS